MPTEPAFPKSTWAITKLYVVRFLTLVVGLILYFYMQFLFSLRGLPDSCIGDVIFNWTASINQYFVTHAQAANFMLATSGFIIDACSVFLFAAGLFGKTMRPAIGMGILVVLRICTAWLCPLYPPDGMIYRDPGFPTIFLTYNSQFDFFYSGHTATTLLAVIEVQRIYHKRWLTFIVFASFLFLLSALWLLRLHYTMDIYAGAVTSMLVAMITPIIIPYIDNFMTKLAFIRPSPSKEG